jgi:hypothetical protein
MIKQPERLADRRFLACAGSPAYRRLGRMEPSQHNLPVTAVPFSGTFHTE